MTVYKEWKDYTTELVDIKEIQNLSGVYEVEIAILNSGVPEDKEYTYIQPKDMYNISQVVTGQLIFMRAKGLGRYEEKGIEVGTQIINGGAVVPQPPSDGNAYAIKDQTWSRITTDWFLLQNSAGYFGAVILRKNSCESSVEIKININKNDIEFSDGETIFTIPDGYRPTNEDVFNLAAKQGQGNFESVSVYVEKNGVARIVQGGNTQNISGSITYPI